MTTQSASASSDVFIKVALDQFTNAKESKKLPLLKDASKAAATAIEASSGHPNPSAQTLKIIFQPFQLACQSRQPILVSIAIDCLAKLFSYNYWGKPDDGGDEPDMDADGNIIIKKPDPEYVAEATKNHLMSLVIDTICDGFASGENTDEKVQLQIIKALSAAVCTPDPTSAIHGAILLKAIRTTYNVFLLSKSPSTQMVAQATLSQMITGVFGRIPTTLSLQDKEEFKKNVDQLQSELDSHPIIDETSPQSQEPHTESPLLSVDEENTEQLKSAISSHDDAGDSADSNVMRPTVSVTFDDQTLTGESKETVTSDIILKDPKNTRVRTASVRKSVVLLKSIESGEQSQSDRDTTYDINIKDAYLVFRAMCKLSMKPIPQLEGATDLKSTGMRSKLLALHLVHSVFTANLNVFFTASHILFSSESAPTSHVLFVHAIKQYLCLTLSRNATSVVPQVFDISIEIFGKVLIGLRSVLKKELSVIFTEIILPIIEAKANITYYQRSSILKSMFKLFVDPASDSGIVLLELYLNFDCDVESGARENIWERLVTGVSKVLSLQIPDSSVPQLGTAQNLTYQSGSINGFLPAMTTASLTTFTKEQVKELYSSSGDTARMKKRGLALLVRGILKQVVMWCDLRIEANKSASPLNAHQESPIIQDGEESKVMISRASSNFSAFQNQKQKKVLLSEGIAKFNSEKPKNGIKYLIESGCIINDTPLDIATFLINTEGLNKKMIGEYLGEGDDRNVQIMHSFVDQMDFTNMAFVDALRLFLQSFRLPGEAQKIDRFMLKFAERYVSGNLQSFSSADTVYILSYSVIMLNTDQHNTQVKKRMTKQDFIKNNRGIDEGKDLPDEFLGSVFDVISTDEIVLNDEQALKVALKDKKEAELGQKNRSKSDMVQVTNASEAMYLNTEARFNNMKNKSSKSTNEKNTQIYLTATNQEHLKPMIQIICQAMLNGMSCALNESDDPEMISIALEGFRYAIYLTCLFELYTERKGFANALAKMSMVNSIQDMKLKNLDSITLLLDNAYKYGNQFTDSWKDVIATVSQLERLQLLGSEGEQEISRIHRNSLDINRTSKDEQPEINSQEMSIAVDKIFTGSQKLDGQAIIFYVRALCEISYDEIMSSTDRDQPRMYCLQRLVEISYYNMNRIRVEWSNMWSILGEHFNQCGCHTNSNVAFFALDQLRQLGMRFLDIEELSNFKFQKDFLRPFEFVILNNPDPKIKDMVLVCLQQMIQSKSKSMKSGWKAIFSAFAKAARESYANISQLTFDIMKNIFKQNFDSVVLNFTFSDFINCLVEFCRNKKFVKTSLHAVEMIKQAIPRMAELSHWHQATLRVGSSTDSMPPLLNLSQVAKPGLVDEDPNYKFWFPILFGLYEIIMTSDLEVRTRALTYLFDTLKQYGELFPMDFWEVIAKGVIFPIFDDLRISKQEHVKFANREDMSVWMSTTLIQALRHLVDLYTHFFSTLRFMTDGVLELLSRCMTQENETLARIGSTCLHQLIESNVQRIDRELWQKISLMFVQLFESTTPHELFFDTTSLNPLKPRPEKKDFQRIIVKCVLHLLLIQTLNETLLPLETYNSIDTKNLFLLTTCLQKSFVFAHDFNMDIEVRTQLYRMGFMKQMPNLLKQETTSVSTFLGVYIRLYSDPLRSDCKLEVSQRLLPLMIDILVQFNSLDSESRKRDVNAWRPVVFTIVQAISDFDDIIFRETLGLFYKELCGLMVDDIGVDMKYILRGIFMRCGVLFGVISESDVQVDGDGVEEDVKSVGLVKVDTTADSKDESIEKQGEEADDEEVKEEVVEEEGLKRESLEDKEDAGEYEDLL